MQEVFGTRHAPDYSSLNTGSDQGAGGSSGSASDREGAAAQGGSAENRPSAAAAQNPSEDHARISGADGADVILNSAALRRLKNEADNVGESGLHEALVPVGEVAADEGRGLFVSGEGCGFCR